MPTFPFGGSYYGLQPSQPAAPQAAPAPPIDPGMSSAPNESNVSNLNNISGMNVSGIDNTGPIPGGMVGDAQTYQFMNFPSTYNPSTFSGGSASQPTDWGDLGLGQRLDNAGQRFSDRIDSLTTSPSISGNNYWQALINGAGLLSPAVGLGAGILQGLDIIEPGETTGNALADVPFTPGMVQQGTANLTNKIYQWLGGSPMNSSYIDPNMSGPPTPNGDPYNGAAGGYVPAQVQGPDYAAPNPAGPQQQQSDFPGWGGAGSIDYSAPPDPFFQNFGAVPGADLFNSIGMSPWQTGDMGGQIGFANAGAGQEYGQQAGYTLGGNGFWAS